MGNKQIRQIQSGNRQAGSPRQISRIEGGRRGDRGRPGLFARLKPQPPRCLWRAVFRGIPRGAQNQAEPFSALKPQEAKKALSLKRQTQSFPGPAPSKGSFQPLKKPLFSRLPHKPPAPRSFKLNIPGLRGQRGFLMAMLLPLLSLMMTGIIGFSLLSLGIKNISGAQKICILTNLSMQKELKSLLKSLLRINKAVSSLHRKRQALQKAFESSLALGLLNLAAALRQQIILVQVRQASLLLKQRALLKSGEAAKARSLKKLRRLLKRLKGKRVREDTSYKKALAMFRKSLGPYAETYHPLPDFPQRQKTVFSWDMGLFYPLSVSLSEEFGEPGLESAGRRYSCGATLEKTAGGWRKRLLR